MPDIASALTQSLSKDGQTTPTANIPLGGFKIVSMADGAAATDAATYGQTAHIAGGNTFTGNQTFTGDLTVNGSVSLSGSLTVTGPVIFSSGTISVGNLTVSSVASIASLNVTGTTNANILNVASVASLNTLRVASTAAIAALSVGRSLTLGTASGSVAAGYINAKGYLIDGASISTTTASFDYIGGLTMVAASSTTISVASGACADSTNTTTIIYTSGTLDLTTTGANGLRTGSLANNTGYAVFLISGASGTALFADTSLTPGTRPAGYTTSYRRIGVFYTNGSAQVRAFVQTGRWFFWSAPALQMNAVGIGGNTTTTALPLITGKRWLVNCQYYATGAGAGATSAILFPGDLTAPTIDDGRTTNALSPFGGAKNLPTDTSSQVKITASGGGNGLSYSLSHIGWFDDGV